ncbi:MAG: hypothetical protein OES70_09445, partial [Desulfobacterales bacterium]|nr:hypothetical protein [Desulfobacterales bacterium]
MNTKIGVSQSGSKIKVDHAKRGSLATPPFPDNGRKDGLSIFASAESAHLNLSGSRPVACLQNFLP